MTDVSGLSQRWNKLRRRCASFKAVSGPTSLDSDASYILTEPVTQYSVVPPNEHNRHQRAASVTPTVDGSSKPIRPFSWRKSHSVEKYEYRDVNLNSSIPEKINKSIPLPDDYWKIHEQDVKLWKIGCAAPNRPMSMRDIPKDVSANDWEFNVQKFETLNGSSLERRRRIQYYTGDADTNQRKQQNGTDGTGGGGERKEIKFPSLKAFKSASMRLPGQKSSLQEVHQMLRNKFNRLNVGLRKKRTLSVQEVFHQSSPTSQSSKGQPPSQFYVPSPMPATKTYTANALDDTASTRSSSDVSSMPYYATNSPNSKGSSALNNQANANRTHSTAVNSLSPSKNGDVKHQSRSSSSSSNRAKSNANHDEKKTLATKDGGASTTAPSSSNGSNGRVSLREKMPNKSTATKISNAVRERIRRRPRSHSPVKPTIETTSSLSKASTAIGGRKNRDAVGLFGRINRIMSVNHLPPPHSNSSNNNNSTNNNMNRAKANGSHDSSSAATAAATASATPKKIQNDETKSTPKSPINQSSIENNGATRSPTKKHQQQTPDTNFLRDRKITNKQVRNNERERERKLGITTHRSPSNRGWPADCSSSFPNYFFFFHFIVM